MTRICAWCDTVIDPDPMVPEITHTICSACQTRVLSGLDACDECGAISPNGPWAEYQMAPQTLESPAEYEQLCPACACAHPRARKQYLRARERRIESCGNR